eukprot:TRINITY_DN945_c0_g1_i2.p1 TRINITY_DN945_c0_g1~~TRINITY_DN945_c0_g1_i2.p1  ORF type:complete len:347 (-),score=50.56 TRINITY_DN945_c0_g1_i2:196-1236(-)
MRAQSAPRQDTHPGALPGHVIKDVWEDNFEEEIHNVMKVIEHYNVIALDTEFPGLVNRPVSNSYEAGEFSYECIRSNVDDLKVIQIGFTFADEKGRMPQETTTWQFNFKFDLSKDVHATDSIELLKRAGINFADHAVRGIDQRIFAEWFTVSNLPFNDDIKWISFHGGFDFAFLLKLLTNERLPDNSSGFIQELKLYFPTFLDIKAMTDEIEPLKLFGLSRLADDLEIRRVGTKHQAGSDSWVTLQAFIKLKEQYMRNHVSAKYTNVLFGIGSETESEFFLGLSVENYFPDFSRHYMQTPAFVNYPHPSMTPPPMIYGYSPELAKLQNMQSLVYRNTYVYTEADLM